jgi:undecaprenyl diphosphate synthase
MSTDIPRHIAIIPDGTRRWARKRGLPEMEGSRAGVETVHRTIEYLIDDGLKYLTIWGFSSDNWKRPEDQVRFLFEQAQSWIEKDSQWLNSRGTKLRHIGSTDRLPTGLKEGIKYCEELTRQNTGMTLMIAFDYTGRAEITEAIRRIVKDGLSPDKVKDEMVSHYLYTEGLPDVDLIIRTGGELRLSNFMIWQVAYSEYYFTPILWPDFDEVELKKALESYSQRHRRFGGD